MSKQIWFTTKINKETKKRFKRAVVSKGMKVHFVVEQLFEQFVKESKGEK